MSEGIVCPIQEPDATVTRIYTATVLVLTIIMNAKTMERLQEAELKPKMRQLPCRTRSLIPGLFVPAKI